MISVITDLKLRGISLHWKLLLSQVNKLIVFFLFFALNKEELLVNYNIHYFYFIGAETRQLVLTVVTQVRKIWNGRTNDFSESYAWIFSLFFVKTRKENNTYLIHQFIIGNVELRLIENG